jgi:hypothetical protein
VFSDAYIPKKIVVGMDIAAGAKVLDDSGLPGETMEDTIVRVYQGIILTPV